MKKLPVLLLISMLFVFVISGCGDDSSNSLEGSWSMQDEISNTTITFADDRWIMRVSLLDFPESRTVHGTYTTSGNRITFTLDGGSPGEPVRYTISGDTLSYGGDNFTRISTPSDNNLIDDAYLLSVDGSAFSTTFRRNDLIYFIGASEQEIIDQLGQPSSASTDGQSLIYPNMGEPMLILSMNNGVVNEILLTSADWALCGLRTVNSVSRVNRAMSKLNAVNSGSLSDPDTNEVHYVYSFLYSEGQFNLEFITHPDGNAIFLEAVSLPSWDNIPSASPQRDSISSPSQGGDTSSPLSLEEAIVDVWHEEEGNIERQFFANGDFIITLPDRSLMSGYFEIDGNTVISVFGETLSFSEVYENVSIDGDILQFDELHMFANEQSFGAFGDGEWRRIGDSRDIDAPAEMPIS